MIIIPERDAKIRSYIDKHIRIDDRNRIKKMKALTWRLLVIACVFFSILFISITKLKDLPKFGKTNDKFSLTNDGGNRIPSDVERDDSNVRPNTIIQLPRKENDHAIVDSVYGVFYGEVSKNGLGVKGVIVDGYAMVLPDENLSSKINDYASQNYKLISQSSNNKQLSEANIGFLKENEFVNSELGNWVTHLWIPEGTSKIILTRNDAIIDTIYVDKLKPIISISSITNVTGKTPIINLTLELGNTHLPIRLSIDLVDVIKRKIIPVVYNESVAGGIINKEIDFDKLEISDQSKYYLHAYLATPFVISQVKSREFINSD